MIVERISLVVVTDFMMAPLSLVFYYSQPLNGYVWSRKNLSRFLNSQWFFTFKRGYQAKSKSAAGDAARYGTYSTWIILGGIGSVLD